MFVGAKKEDGVVTFLIQFDGQAPKIMPSNEAKEHAINFISYLEKKMTWSDESETMPETQDHVLVRARKGCTSPVICMNLFAILFFSIQINTNSHCRLYLLFSDAAKTGEGVLYFFDYGEKKIAIVKSQEAMINHSELVLDYLIKNIHLIDA